MQLQLQVEAPLSSAPALEGDSIPNYEAYTPEALIAPARQVLGHIDLDPASCELANSVVQARQYFTEEENALEQDWWGKIWLNPPFSRKWIAPFAEKILAELGRGQVEEMILLTNNSTSADWCQSLMNRSDAVCFLDRRWEFWGPYADQQRATGKHTGNRYAQMIFYFWCGCPFQTRDRAWKFAEVYKELGWVGEKVPDVM